MTRSSISDGGALRKCLMTLNIIAKRLLIDV